MEENQGHDQDRSMDLDVKEGAVRAEALVQDLDQVMVKEEKSRNAIKEERDRLIQRIRRKLSTKLIQC